MKLYSTFYCAYCFNCGGIQVLIYQKCKKEKKETIYRNYFSYFHVHLR